MFNNFIFSNDGIYLTYLSDVEVAKEGIMCFAVRSLNDVESYSCTMKFAIKFQRAKLTCEKLWIKLWKDETMSGLC